MSKFKSIYVWENVDNIIKRIESKIQICMTYNYVQKNMRTVNYNILSVSEN